MMLAQRAFENEEIFRRIVRDLDFDYPLHRDDCYRLLGSVRASLGTSKA